ncbi:hypothetical protein GQ457_08G017340 [Hibiscus cannabinus]
MGSELQKTASKEVKSDKSLINGPNLMSEKEYEDFLGPLIEAPLDHSNYEKESFSIDVDDRSLTVSLDSRTNPFEENKAQINSCIGGLKQCILDKKLKLVVKSEKSANLRRLLGWDHEAIRFSNSSRFVVEDLHTLACLESFDFDTLGHYSSSEMIDFQDYLAALVLSDHPYYGPLFTWTNKQEGSFLARKLDRLLINDHCIHALPTSHSKHVDFKSIVAESWTVACTGNPMQVLFSKLKRLKPRLNSFNKEYMIIF